MQTIYLCYSQKDREKVAATRTALAKMGYQVSDPAMLSAGEKWAETIAESIRTSDMLLLFISPAAADSKWVRREIQFADKLDKPLLIIQLRPTALPIDLEFLLANHHILPYQANFLPALEEALCKQARQTS